MQPIPPGPPLCSSRVQPIPPGARLCDSRVQPIPPGAVCVIPVCNQSRRGPVCVHPDRHGQPWVDPHPNTDRAFRRLTSGEPRSSVTATVQTNCCTFAFAINKKIPQAGIEPAPQIGHRIVKMMIPLLPLPYEQPFAPSRSDQGIIQCRQSHSSWIQQ